MPVACLPTTAGVCLRPSPLAALCRRYRPLQPWWPGATGLCRGIPTRAASSKSAGEAPGTEAGPYAQDGTDALAVQGARVYRRLRPEHQRVFKWGVGNKFRSQSANRFTPVHKPHPKEIPVRDDYYESSNPNIVWEDLNESWEVYWYEHTKLNAKPFPVKKYGLEQAKREAITFYDELAANGRLQEKPRIESPQEGVFFDARAQTWTCLFWRDGRPLSRSFSATKYGFDGAKSLAVAKQNDPVNGVLPLAHSGGGTPLIDKEPWRAQMRMIRRGASA
eukprot:TRINITY_DN27192_c0_g1_i1.p2 TRINITY_DN27192_c0_g1~~TRINITY_DN27192_c0_g1_i1.p2  ORF type:complete len:277 (+),score=47.41 TRINITY_DN27192_c0_g1_i1:69-899(+)